MNELKFSTAQDYLNYDFDDNFCFYFNELKEYGESIEKIDPAPFVDYVQKFADIITGLFKIYDFLIIDTVNEKLYGEIGGTRYFIKDGMHEDE